MEWQPIETAPKGERVLVYFPRTGRKEAMIIAASNPTGSQWWAKHIGNLFPTHWMPLPEPPK